MNSRKPIFKDTLAVAVGQILGVAAMIGVFALLGKFDMTVLWGGAVGGILALANFFFMSLFADMAADKAEKQDVAGGQKLIQLSYMGRMIGLALVLIVCGISDRFNLLALVIPLVFVRPILAVAEIFKKKGDHEA